MSLEKVLVSHHLGGHDMFILCSSTASENLNVQVGYEAEHCSIKPISSAKHRTWMAHRTARSFVISQPSAHTPTKYRSQVITKIPYSCLSIRC